MTMREPGDLQRFEHLYTTAVDAKNAAAKEFNNEQVGAAASRKEYFEKLAFGSAAAIAAIVSFVGTHSGRLQPPWLLRCSLISLVVAVVAALYRNLRFPSYALQVRRNMWMEAVIKETEHKRGYVQVALRPVDIDTGKPIDPSQYRQESEEFQTKVAANLERGAKRVIRLVREANASEWLCLTAVGVATISLVWLAIRNF